MKVTVTVADGDWQDALDELAALLPDAARDASAEGAERIQGIARGMLTAQRHGFQTRTPSVAPEPPAAISGALAASVLVTPVPDELGAEVGPTTVYGRIQELGGEMKGHPWMRWYEDGIRHFSRAHSLPPRPSLKPATETVIDTGQLEIIYEKHVLEAIMEVTG